MLARAPQFAEDAAGRDVDLQAARPRGCATRGCARRRARRCPRCASSAPLERPRDGRSRHARRRCRALLEPEAEVYAALVLGTRDYVTKNGFEHVVLGLSGGIDSTLSR